MGDRPSIATLLDALFCERLHPEGRQYTYLEVAVLSGGKLRPAHLQKLRRGQIMDPRISTVRHLCHVFGVLPCYFFGMSDLAAAEDSRVGSAPQSDPLS